MLGRPSTFLALKTGLRLLSEEGVIPSLHISDKTGFTTAQQRIRIEKSIEVGHPILLGVQMKPYINLRNGLPHNQQKLLSISGHAVLVIGIDDPDKFIIYDWNDKWPISLPADNLANRTLFNEVYGVKLK